LTNNEDLIILVLENKTLRNSKARGNMVITSKQIRRYIYLIIVYCSSTYVTKAMEQLIPDMEKKAEEESSFWANLSPELKAHIVSFLETAKDRKEAIRNIRAFSLTSKEFNTLINDPEVLSGLIVGISRRSYGSLSIAAFYTSLSNVSREFKKPAVYWLRHYMQQHPQAKDVVFLLAVQVGSQTLTQYLLNAGADANQKDNGGWTPLSIAALNGHKDIVALLLNAGADVNQAQGRGYVPLHLAAELGYRDIVELLLVYGADVNKANDAGYVSLHWAAYSGNKDIVELLLAYGADVNKVASDGITALGSATQHGYKEIVKLLLKHGAKRDGLSCSIL
jgi:hypothetical protein